MALELISTPGASDANAFVDLDYVTHLAESSGDAGAAWLLLDDDQKIGTIIAATRSISTRRYCGERTTPETQRLSFPRSGLCYYADDVIPVPVQEATAIEAIARTPLFKTGATSPLFPTPATAAAGVKRFRKKTGPQEKETEYFAPTTVAATSVQSLTADAQLLLADLLCGDDTDGYGWSVQRRTS